MDTLLLFGYENAHKYSTKNVWIENAIRLMYTFTGHIALSLRKK